MEGNKKYIFLENGMVLACTAYFSNFAMQIANRTLFSNKELALITAISLGGGFLLDKLFKDSEYEKLFRLCGIENKDKKVPLVIKKEIKGNQTTLVLNMPEGLSQKQFEEKHTELEQALNSKIEYGFNKNLIMKLQEMNLGTKYDYEFEECEEPTKIFIGYSHEGKFYFDIDEAVQTLIAGEPKSGKSSLLRTICLSLILSKHNLELRLIDFQNVELGIFQDCKKVKSYGKAPPEFEKLLNEMRIESERRLDVYASVRNQRFIQNLGVWNKYYPDKAMPYIIVVIDEFARLAHEEYKPLLEEFMNRVAMDRKCGVLYLVSCQRPDVKVISGSIKGCMPTRIAYRVVTDTDSKVILDIEGAEKIKQRGRCIMKYNGEIKEVQTLYIEPEDVRKILKKNKAFKTAEEKELEKQLAKKKQIEEFRKKHGNGYPSGGVNIDN